MTGQSFGICVEHSQLFFSAMHFVVYSSGNAEPLHGHDFHVSMEIAGPLNPQGMVIDFLVVKEILFCICQQLNGKVLLPGKLAELRLQTAGHIVSFVIDTKSYQFPEEQLLFLPLENITTELLCQYMAQEWYKKWKHCHKEELKGCIIKLELEESPGCKAYFTFVAE